MYKDTAYIPVLSVNIFSNMRSMKKKSTWSQKKKVSYLWKPQNTGIWRVPRLCEWWRLSIGYGDIRNTVRYLKKRLIREESKRGYAHEYRIIGSNYIKYRNQTWGDRQDRCQWKRNGTSWDNWLWCKKWIHYADNKGNEDKTRGKYALICQ